MNVLVTGAGGLIGSQLVPFLTTGGHTVRRLTRGEADAGAGTFTWDPAGGAVDEAAFDGVDAVVHLAGESIADGRWNDAKKRRIRDSRTGGTRFLAERLKDREQRPQVLVCASAIGFYGSRGDELLDERSSAGDDFLADVCSQWEAACQPARDAGIRVVNLRIGVVLSAAGGALEKMLLPFQLGAGGVVGSGRQYMSWIALDDLLKVILHALADDELHGAVNATAPAPVSNREFTKTLGRVLRRPTIVPMPAFAARLAFGEMADALLLSSARVVPKRLTQAGFEFAYPSLEGALRHVLGR